MRNVNRTIKSAGMALTAGLVLAGCSTSPTFVDYGDNQLYSTGSAGNVPYVELGPVSATKRGFFWDSCQDLANAAAEQLRTQGESRGATHIINVRWLDHGDGTFSEQPICTTGWGWFAALGAGGFTPWVKVTEAHGSLATVELSGLSGARQVGDERVASYRAQRAAEFRARQEAQARAEREAQAEAEAAEEDDEG